MEIWRGGGGGGNRRGHHQVQVRQVYTNRGHLVKSPFQSQLMILQNAIDNWHTLHEHFSDPRAETLLQTGVSCSYVLYVITAKHVSFRDIFTIIKKRLILL